MSKTKTCRVCGTAMVFVRHADPEDGPAGYECPRDCYPEPRVLSKDWFEEVEQEMLRGEQVKPRGRLHIIWYVLSAHVRDARLRFVCLVRGHDLVDLDPGDPEVGPDPHIICRRCDAEQYEHFTS